MDIRSKNEKNLFSALYPLPFVLCGVMFLLLSNPSLYGQVTSIEEILDYPERFDGGTVTIEGELIGEPLKEQSGTWINISSEGHNIGVFVPDVDSLGKVRWWGSYKTQGDYVKISGKFSRNCPLHNGHDVHAYKIDVVQEGFAKNEVIKPFKIRLAIVFFIICLTLMIVYLIKIWRR
ncbi:MAG: hypothetical protein JSW40_00125 [Candidatus Omnitrophota bacterium]|nr:MAG: hypothetical protein JSW40_00125 [Candidatus Omnitrophota bacterium]